MRFFLIALLFSASALAAESPEESYLAARDAYIARFTDLDEGNYTDALFKQHDDALADLGKQIEQIVGPVAVEGFSSEGKSSLDTLFSDDAGFGIVDGVAYPSTDPQSRLVVTTETLLKDWLKEHKDWWEDVTMPMDIPAALKMDAFYTQAISTDAAVDIYAEVPVTRPANPGLATAILDGRSQDIIPQIPNELIVTVIAGGRVFILTAPTIAKIDPIPVCEAIWQDSVKRGETPLAAYYASDSKDETLFDDYIRLQSEGVAAFHRCYAAQAAKQPFFAAVTRQAQALVDLLPTK